MRIFSRGRYQFRNDKGDVFVTKYFGFDYNAPDWIKKQRFFDILVYEDKIELLDDKAAADKAAADKAAADKAAADKAAADKAAADKAAADKAAADKAAADKAAADKAAADKKE